MISIFVDCFGHQTSRRCCFAAAAADVDAAAVASAVSARQPFCVNAKQKQHQRERLFMFNVLWFQQFWAFSELWRSINGVGLHKRLCSSRCAKANTPNHLLPIFVSNHQSRWLQRGAPNRGESMYVYIWADAHMFLSWHLLSQGSAIQCARLLFIVLCPVSICTSKLAAIVRMCHERTRNAKTYFGCFYVCLWLQNRPQ